MHRKNFVRWKKSKFSSLQSFKIILFPNKNNTYLCTDNKLYILITILKIWEYSWKIEIEKFE